MPLLHRGRPLKRWRYIAVFNDELMACAANVQVGPAKQSFWALYTRGDRQLRERTRLLPRRGLLELTPGRLRLNDGNVSLELDFAEDAGIEARCPNGRAWVWTRKQAGVHAHGTLSLDGGAKRPIEALAVIDETAGYHARVTEWRWAAGVGVDPEGTPLAFNLVEGVNDPPNGSERAIWVAGLPREVPPVSFAADLTAVTAADGSELRFTPEAERRRRENMLIVRSEYRAPFGVFSGTLPGGVQLTHGLGVMEHHRARW
ncbi:MAG TPA: DUF2804 family protein [Solirubrobacteraceae bacterium]|jgi:hypothetical protein